ncbi:MAG: glycosyltransferase family 39 protein [Acidobacteria bacterium]|nr:glycosyltransferase family 39 protein [Acidobacteriota bacterium]
MADPSSSRQPSRRLYWGLLFACVAGALALAAIAAIPAESLRLTLILVDRDASRHFLTPNQLFIVKAGAAAAAGFLLAETVWLVVVRTRTVAYLAKLEADFEIFRSQLRTDLRLLDRRDGLVLAVIVLVGFALRLNGFEHPWRFDESDSLIHFVRSDWFNLWTDYTQPNNHIFYNLLAHFSVEAFPEFSSASRIPALVAGVLSVPALFVAGRILFDTQAALLAAALAACLPPLVDFSTNARGYSLVTLLLLLAIVASSVLRRRGSISAWVVISILMTAAMFAVPTALFALGTLLALLLLCAEANRRGSLVVESVGCIAVCGFASILLYTPPAMRGTWAVIVSNPFVQPMRWDQALDRISNYLEILWTPADQPSALLSLAIVVAALFAGARTATGLRLLTAVAIPAAALCVAGRFIPPPRVWLYAFPLIVLAAAAGAMQIGASKLKPRQTAVAACLLLAIGFSFARALTPGFELRFYGEVEQIADFLVPQLDSSSAVIVPTPMSDPLQLRLLEGDSSLTVGFDPRDLKVGRRTLEGRSKVWIVRPRQGAYLGWENGRRDFSLTQPYLTDFADPRLVTTSEFLEVWSAGRR